MATFNELLQDFVNKSYEELMELANYSLSRVSDEIESVLGSRDTATNAYMVLIAACLGVDGEISQLEYKFLKELYDMDMDYASVKDVIDALKGEKAMELTDTLVDALSSDGKSALITLCLCFLAVDETITRDEVAFVVKLMQ